VVVARGGAVAARWPAPVSLAVERGLRRVADDAARVLRQHWPDTATAVVELPPVEGILAEARRTKARAIVVGVRGQGRLSRFVLGSVSRGVVRHAACPVLVVKGRSRPMRRIVVGLDGSANARRAVTFLAGLEAPPGGRVTVVRVVEPVRPPSGGLLPATVRAFLASQLKALVAERLRAAKQDVEHARQQLARAGWKVSAIIRVGVPTSELLAAVGGARVDLLAIGARGVGGIERLLLGSVAEGALTRSPVSVLVVK
jgi:nucleotide-binding universal stress UspA family protein